MSGRSPRGAAHQQQQTTIGKQLSSSSSGQSSSPGTNASGTTSSRVKTRPTVQPVEDANSKLVDDDFELDFGDESAIQVSLRGKVSLPSDKSPAQSSLETSNSIATAPLATSKALQNKDPDPLPVVAEPQPAVFEGEGLGVVSRIAIVLLLLAEMCCAGL